MAEGEKTVVGNRRAFHDYAIEDKIEAGIVLVGTEVKALREGKGTLSDAYAAIEGNAIWLYKLHIAPYTQASTHVVIDPDRPRKLLLHAEEMRKLWIKTAQRGYTLIPTRVYFKNGLVKVELGLGKGKTGVDKRDSIKDRDMKRELDREMRHRNR